MTHQGEDEHGAADAAAGLDALSLFRSIVAAGAPQPAVSACGAWAKRRRWPTNYDRILARSIFCHCQRGVCCAACFLVLPSGLLRARSAELAGDVWTTDGWRPALQQ